MATRTRPSSGLSYQPRQTPTLDSVALRLHQLHGDAASRWARRLTGPESSFRHVALMLTELRAAGLNDAITERMALIEQAVGPTEVLSLKDAVDRHNALDALEDCAQSEWVRTEDDTALDGWIKRVSAQINNDERLLGCLVAEKQRRREAR